MWQMLWNYGAGHYIQPASQPSALETPIIPNPSSLPPALSCLSSVPASSAFVLEYFGSDQSLAGSLAEYAAETSLGCVRPRPLDVKPRFAFQIHSVLPSVRPSVSAGAVDFKRDVAHNRISYSTLAPPPTDRSRSLFSPFPAQNSFSPSISE